MPPLKKTGEGGHVYTVPGNMLLTCTSNMKSVALTVLQLLTFNNVFQASGQR